MINIYLIIFVVFGSINLIEYYLNAVVPDFSVSAYTILFGFMLLFYGYVKNKFSILILFYVFTFFLPFIHLFEYFGYDFSKPPPPLMWGLATNPYTGQKDIVDLMAFMGGIAMFAIVLALFFPRNLLRLDNFVFKKTRDSLVIPGKNSVMGLPHYLFWLSIGVFFSFLFSPLDSVFTSSYTYSQSLLDILGISFGSIWVFSYAILVYLMADFVIDNSQSKKIKGLFLALSLIYVVVFLQFLKGDRESITLVAAVLFIYIFDQELKNKLNRKMQIYLIFIFGLIVFPLAYLVGTLRSLLSVMNLEQAWQSVNMSQAISGTWSAILLHPLSMAGDTVNGLIKFKNGQTYLDLFLSLPPGFVAEIFGYVRPIDASKGPAWELSYAMGGSSAIVAPYLNFGLTGILIIIFVLTLFIRHLDNIIYIKPSKNRLMLFGSLVMIIPHWLWYGDKNFINIMIIWYLLTIVFGLSTSFFRILNLRNEIIYTSKK